MIKVALVGCGAVSSSHFAAWRRISSAKIEAVCDSNVSLLNKAAEYWKIPKKFTSVAELANFSDITLWDICTPISTHKDLAIQAMKEDFNVLIEKPMTLTAEDAKAILRCQNATGRKAGVIHNWLFEPPILEASAMVKDQKVGEIIGAQIDVLHTKDDSMTANEGHWSHRLPGGRFSEMLVHPIYLLRNFIGDIRVESVVTSKAGNYPWMKQDELIATFTAGNKLAGTYVSFNAPRNAIYVSLFGTKGVLKVDIITATLQVLPRLSLNRYGKALDAIKQGAQLSKSTFKNALRVVSKQWFDGHEKCIRLFAKSISENTEVPVTVKEGYEVARILESMCKRIE